MPETPAATYLTTRELADRIKYKPTVINNMLKDAVLIEGVHYIRPFGRRKVLYLWEAVERAMLAGAKQAASHTSMAG